MALRKVIQVICYTTVVKLTAYYIALILIYYTCIEVYRKKRADTHYK
jgi:hypothetical protein